MLDNKLKVREDHLKLAKFRDGSPEIFATVQGEGPSTGIPAVFIRLSLCNLACVWCDTPYTWNWTGTNFTHRDAATGANLKYCLQKEIVSLTPVEIMGYVTSIGGPNIKCVIITGGEPLLHRNSSAFKTLLSTLKSAGYRIEIETNCTLVPGKEIVPFIDQFNVSPKLANSNNSLKMRRKNRPYQFFADRENAYFKFVVTGAADLEEIFEVQRLYGIPAARILLMPEGRTDEETRKRSQEIVELCKEHGYRFCNRLHVWIWDGTLRGV